MTSGKSVTRSAPSSVQATTLTSSLLTVQTPGRGFTDLTGEAGKFVAEASARDGALTL
ncbi:MAG: YjbQ family protein, partial [Bradyrhizobium canariense]